MYGNNRHSIDATLFFQSEQEALNKKIKPIFNKYISQAVDLQKNGDLLSLKKSEDKFKKALALTKHNQYAKSSILNNLSQLISRPIYIIC